MRCQAQSVLLKRSGLLLFLPPPLSPLTPYGLLEPGGLCVKAAESLGPQPTCHVRL